ncbi:MAG: ATP-binding protein [Deltaproteobacteria bacterium]|nr:ATP-binding protein [Deltaproteobacteria bacterium]
MQTLTKTPWREAAIQGALGSSGGEYANPSDYLLLHIRQNFPKGCSVLVTGEASRYLPFLRSISPKLVSMLDCQHWGHGWRGPMLESVFWWSFEFEGARIEAVSTPGAQTVTGMFLLCERLEPLEQLGKLWESFSTRPEGRTLIHSHGWKSSPELDAEIGRTTWAELVLPKSLLEDIRRTVAGFVNSREAFESLGFPWRRGILLVGPPGTGKTLVCRAVAAELTHLPFLYVRDLTGSEYGKNPIAAIFERARQLSPCILVFEDLDSFVNDGNRAVFLNEIDGFVANTGLLIIASSNHPERIDEALLKRPSRFDRVFHLGLPGEAERAEYGRRLLTRSAIAKRITSSFDIDAVSAQIARDTDGFTPAYLKELYLAAALALAQEGITELDARYVAELQRQLQLLRAQMRKTKDAVALGSMDNQEIGFRQ